MPKDPTIAIRDCLAEIAILHEVEGRMTLQAFRSDPIVRRAAAYAIQIISEAVRQIPDDWLADRDAVARVVNRPRCRGWPSPAVRPTRA